MSYDDSAHAALQRVHAANHKATEAEKDAVKITCENCGTWDVNSYRTERTIGLIKCPACDMWLWRKDGKVYHEPEVLK